HVVAFRPEASLLYVNADSVLESVSKRLEAEAARDIRLVVCDLSASPHIDLAGARMLHQLHLDLARRGIALRVLGAVDGCALCCEQKASENSQRTRSARDSGRSARRRRQMSSSLCEALERPPRATHRRCNAERRNTPVRPPRRGTLVPLDPPLRINFKQFY